MNSSGYYNYCSVWNLGERLLLTNEVSATMVDMAGLQSGCRAAVQAHVPKAIYVHCAAHRLNLAVLGLQIQEFQNTELCMGEIARFFRLSAKWKRFLGKASWMSLF